MTSSPTIPTRVRDAFDLEDDAVPITNGLINQTFRATSGTGETLIVQSVNAIFPPEVHEDIYAVTEHLVTKGLTTPRLKRTRERKLFVRENEHIWRALSYVPGESHDHLETPTQAAAAGRLLAGWHAALSDLTHEFKGQRIGVHDTDRHVRVLETALEQHSDHRLFVDARVLADSIIRIAADTPRFDAFPKRVVHGDPKINNLLFDPETGEGVCMVDLDTVGPLELPIELGDAFRSWCNPSGEDDERVEFSVALFEGAISGYAEHGRSFMSSEEKQALPDGIQLVITELAARFCADALNESYFGWDQARFPRRGEHNLLRARGQLALVESYMQVRGQVEQTCRRAFA